MYFAWSQTLSGLNLTHSMDLSEMLHDLYLEYGALNMNRLSHNPLRSISRLILMSPFFALKEKLYILLKRPFSLFALLLSILTFGYKPKSEEI